MVRGVRFGGSGEIRWRVGLRAGLASVLVLGRGAVMNVFGASRTRRVVCLGILLWVVGKGGGGGRRGRVVWCWRCGGVAEGLLAAFGAALTLDKVLNFGRPLMVA